MKKKKLLFKIHSLEENRKELLLVLTNVQSDLHDYIIECKKQNNTVTQQQKLINEQKELIDELLKNKSTSDSKQKLIECLTSSLFEELNKNKLLKESKFRFYYCGKEMSIEEMNLYIKGLEANSDAISEQYISLLKELEEFNKSKPEPKRKKFLGIF
jgi:hypothetical protein